MTVSTFVPARIDRLIIAGWTGRDQVAQEKHIVELEKVGVKRPPATPIYYRASASRLTTAGVIEVPGGDSSGEVEFVIVQLDGRLWIGAGSDHTDRKVETYNITVSKQMCDKPVAGELWLFDELAAHWDRLILRSWAVTDGNRRVYQQGSVTAMLHPRDTIARYKNGSALNNGTAMFGGTLAALGGIQPADRFEFELEDPVLERRLAHGYDIRRLPIEG